MTSSAIQATPSHLVKMLSESTSPLHPYQSHPSHHSCLDYSIGLSRISKEATIMTCCQHKLDPVSISCGKPFPVWQDKRSHWPQVLAAGLSYPWLWLPVYFFLTPFRGNGLLNMGLNKQKNQIKFLILGKSCIRLNLLHVSAEIISENFPLNKIFPTNAFNHSTFQQQVPSVTI